MRDEAPSCDVSFAVACYDALPYLDAAIESALSQAGVSVEVLVVEDHGSDASLAHAQAWQARDPRVRVFRTPANGGPGAARNIAIDEMRGRWFAVLDSDDLLAPQRSRLLIDVADAHGADLIADDLVLFGEGIEEHRFLPPELAAEGGRWIDPEFYFASTIMLGTEPNLGFLKPMIRKSALDTSGVRYDPGLRIGEDDALIVRLLLAGLSYYLMPEPGYRYRKHGASISHRLSLANAEKMLRSEHLLRADLAATGLAGRAYRRRLGSIERAVAFTHSVEAMKARKPLAALAPLLANPRAALLYALPLKARIGRILGRGQ
ncbi:glycosyltransferase family 2 protein [Qipengyuania spongiae]|uniref:Glycosyltransferase family 2 protein n=1 Tax=Qipengyuania spongiae TaxID=2909673 RepID=A0ABY5T0Q5_9SPHN|nr:glycosyltransferase family 2 protein [Qipengyuania spongiae]UVI39084.1 glycosyltransferase family 2 protein [Qipengyuania spongiae]